LNKSDEDQHRDGWVSGTDAEQAIMAIDICPEMAIKIVEDNQPGD